ncbi:hypothetical protein PAPYR_10253 [Paratrimastix pyriformis]|uniref:Uncharacterized protein n=1 Tax=Paratrimastix pyriformis TaxID=342808 RepID=A0ABQ8UAI6_9EUKA|nr:hypothetical protein PAPYR_10253 [Paratrimastix pyriformis]
MKPVLLALPRGQFGSGGSKAGENTEAPPTTTTPLWPNGLAGIQPPRSVGSGSLALTRTGTNLPSLRRLGLKVLGEERSCRKDNGGLEGDATEQEADHHFLEHAPSELLRAIVEASDWALRTYAALIGLSQRTRARLLGTLREMSFENPDHVDPYERGTLALTPTANAMAALLGPCKTLVKLSFPNESESLLQEDAPLLFGCGATAAACAAWVDEAFAGHGRLTSLRLPREPFLPALGRILGHLPGLVELHIMYPPFGGFAASFDRAPAPDVLRITSTLRGSMPPALRVLRLDFPVLGQALEDLVAALAPCAGTLEELDVARCELGEVQDFLGRFPSISRLTLGPIVVGDLQPVAARLTQLTVRDLFDRKLLALPNGGGLLESLKVDFCSGQKAVACLLPPNQDTLRHIALGSPWEDEAAVDLLSSLPHLTSLELDLGPTGFIPPNSLLNRLEHLALSAKPKVFDSIGITSERLRSLCLHLTIGPSATVTLDCPALETITGLPREEGDEPYDLECPRLSSVQGYDLVLECPRLRSVQGLPATANVLLPPVMPDLVMVEAAAEEPGREPPWLPTLLAAAPRLREARLDRAGDGALPPSSILKEGQLLLPAQLTHADITMPILRLHGLADSLRVTVICPALTSLTIDLGGRVAFVVAQGTPRFFMLDGCDEAVGPSLVAFLSSTGGAAARLRRVALRRIETGPCWPQIMAALAGLPLLASLVLTNTGSPAATVVPFSLSSPSLRHLCIRFLQVSALELNCPLLEELWASFEDIRRFALIGPAPRQGTMRRIGHSRSVTWAAQMERLFPGATVER